MNNEYNVANALFDYLDESLPYKREVSFFATPDEGIISATTNNSGCSVAFDWDTIWFDHLKIKKSEYVLMFHTHPSGISRMSSTDYNMVYGWVLALGVPIKFIVITDRTIAEYICFIDRPSKEVKIELNYVESKYFSEQYSRLAYVIYGLSCSESMDNEKLKKIITEVNQINILNLLNLNQVEVVS